MKETLMHIQFIRLNNSRTCGIAAARLPFVIFPFSNVKATIVSDPMFIFVNSYIVLFPIARHHLLRIDCSRSDPHKI